MSPHRITAAFIAAALLATAGSVGAPQPAQANSQKVAVIVGPTEITDSHYRLWAEQLGAKAASLGATVDFRYCPTPAQAKQAANGAGIIVYFGHGNGFPNPYSATENPLSVNGWGLRDPSRAWDGKSCRDNVLRYYGQSYLTGKASGNGWTGGGITPAAGFTMVYSNACYAPGAGESRPAPASTVALARVANYSDPILELGGTYFATDLGSERLVELLLTNGSERFGRIFSMGNGYSATALERHPHPDHPGAQAWVQKTTNQWLGTDYWYAFAGNPDKTPSGAVLPSDGPELTRLAGADRYATAAAISKASFDPGVEVAYVATGVNFPDALAAGAAAARYGGPVLLTSPSSVPAATAGELARLKPQTIKVVGGPAVIADDVLAQLAVHTSGSVTRISGVSRYATAAAISQDAFAAGVPVAYIATGENFPDALAGVAAAGTHGGPILLTRPSELSPETRSELSRLRPGRIVVLGATGAVSDGVRDALTGYTTGGVTRLSGADRYATAVAISSGTFTTSTFSMTERTVFIATGAAFPDALGGGPVAGRLPAPLLLVPGTSVPSSVASELVRLNPARVVFLGGTSAVSNTVVSQVQTLLGF